jgi:hypothetical protein
MDKILNLSAFGDVTSTEKTPTTDNSSPVSSDKTPVGFGKVFSRILQNSAQAKLLHWQSKMYGQHKALDKLFDGIIDLGDNLAESIMGKYGRPVLSDSELCLNLMNFKQPDTGDLTEFMEHLTNCYSKECREFFDPTKDSEIINILDELLSLIDKTKYLLTLR